MKRLAYIAHSNIPPHDWAHSLQIMKMCEAFAENGLEVTLIVPRRNIPLLHPNYTDYSMSQPYSPASPLAYSLVELPVIDLSIGSTSKFFYWLRFLSFLVSARFYLFKKKFDVVYTREFYFLPFFRKVYYECHALPQKISWFKKEIFGYASGIVVLTSFIKNKIIEFGINEEKILVAPDAVRLEDFADQPSLIDARDTIGLPNRVHIFGYVGTLKTMGMEKGVGTAIDSLDFLPKGFMLYIVGGEAADIEFYKKYVEEKGQKDRVRFAGRVPAKDVPLHIAACSSVVAPFPNVPHYAYYMSPLKIFEYMAARRPMIVTDLPSLREILEDNVTALFVPPSDSQALARAIERLSQDGVLGENISAQAYKIVEEKYTWKKRAHTIALMFTY